MKYVDAIGSNIQLGNNAVILYFDEGFTDYVVIADTGSISPCSFDVDEENEELVFTFCGETASEKASKKSTDLIIEDNALENIGVMAGSNQATINRQLDLLFGRERTIDSQLSCSSSNPVENKVITNALRLKQDLLESGINIKTINNQTLLGAGNINIEGGGGSVEIVTAWEDTPSDSKVPSEKLAKNSLDGKANTNHSHGFITNDGKCPPTIDNYADLSPNNMPLVARASDSLIVRSLLDAYVIVDPVAHTNIGSSANARQKKINSLIDTALGNKADNEDIPTNLSDLTNDMDFIEKSNTSGLVRNDGTIDITNYSTFSGSYIDLTNKPNIPSAISDLTNDSDFIEKSSTLGLIRNDGTIDTTNYLSNLPAHTHDDRYYTEAEVDTALNSKQNTLISGTNIKTINNTSLLGSGNINIQGGGSITVDSTWIQGSTNPAESQLIQSALSGKADNEDIPTNLSDLNNDEGFVTQNHTHSIEDTDLFSVLDCVNDNFDDLSDGNYIIILGSD